VKFPGVESGSNSARRLCGQRFNDVNGLLLHIDIVQRDNENGDVKGGKGANTSVGAGHRHD